MSCKWSLLLCRVRCLLFVYSVEGTFFPAHVLFFLFFLSVRSFVRSSRQAAEQLRLLQEHSARKSRDAVAEKVEAVALTCRYKTRSTRQGQRHRKERFRCLRHPARGRDAQNWVGASFLGVFSPVRSSHRCTVHRVSHAQREFCMKKRPHIIHVHGEHSPTRFVHSALKTKLDTTFCPLNATGEGRGDRQVQGGSSKVCSSSRDRGRGRGTADV